MAMRETMIEAVREDHPDRLSDRIVTRELDGILKGLYCGTGSREQVVGHPRPPCVATEELPPSPSSGDRALDGSQNPMSVR